MKRKAIAMVVLSVGMLTACSTSPAEPGDTISEITHIYQGHELHCVVTARHTQSATMSCDFVRWHAENPGD